MDSSIVVTINARARGRHGHRRRGERALPAGGLDAGAAVPTIGDPQALAFAREIDRLQRQVAALSARPVDADEAARQRLARELHDCVGAELAATRFALANVRTWLPADAPPQCEDALALVQRSLDAACNATREVLADLYAPRLDAGLVRTLSGWIRDFGARTGLRTSFVCAADGRLARLPDDAALAVFRVAQEALANVARHARATGADVRLDCTPQALTLTVADDGVGMPRGARRRAGHYGVAGMRERCRAFGGALRIVSARADNAYADPHTAPRADARHGTTVRARFAWGALAGAAATRPLDDTRGQPS
ncbi:sensor histidine kinase [Paraburkholderia caballeronis]|uniref:sensor histidine kinase n=1 Tax=Paraburkholderia caballeronis TaxID=416943 RepID=UPI0010668202|nr:histidine kinase [Paraburkholderia caballeronis]TDV18603.1 histidine kinase [Paraburkholderia caballeronis]TDV19859.1 histidine kinase [Paraburkholderia caballeronis]TDV28076.1 histidine kinase [Paraburkholderia caballeronis]